MKLKRLMIYLTVTLMVFSLIPSTVLALWLNDPSIETDYRTFQCGAGGGEINISFFNDAGKKMNFYQDEGRVLVDDAALKDEYVKAGKPDAGDLLVVGEEVTTIVYPISMFGHLEVTVKPVSGYVFSRFTDVTCGCFVDLKDKDGVYTINEENVPYMSVIFEQDPETIIASPIPKVIPDLSITLNGAPVITDVPPYIENNRTMVPVRAISEAFGADVKWNSEKRLVTITGANGTVIELTIGDPVLSVTKEGSSPKPVTMDVSAVLKDSRTFVPVRFIADALGLSVDWNSESRTVILKGMLG